eukprot:EG_transcript_14376
MADSPSPSPALNATFTPTPEFDSPDGNHTFAPVFSASVVAVCLLLVVWCILRCTRRRPPAASWRADGPKTQTADPAPEVKSQRSVSFAAASDRPSEAAKSDDTSHQDATKTRVRSRMQSYVPETESANSSSDHGGSNEIKPLIHRSMSSAMHRICQSPVAKDRKEGTLELPNSIPSPSSSFHSGSIPDGQSDSSRGGQLKQAGSDIFSDTVETYRLPVATAGSKHNRGIILPDGPTAGLVWTGPALTPQSGTWSVISPVEEAVDRHIDNIVTAEVAHLNAAYAMQVGSPNKHYEEAEVIPRQRRRRASSVDSATFGPALRRSRYLNIHRDQLSASTPSVPDLEAPDLQSVSGRIDELSDGSMHSAEV